MKKKQISELRQDLISGEWVVISRARAQRPQAEDFKKRKKFFQPKETCPFENPQKTGHGKPLLIYWKDKNPSIELGASKKDWALQVVNNKFPAFGKGICSYEHKEGPYSWLEGVGFHEVVILRNHSKNLAQLSESEIELLLKAYQERYLKLQNEPCVEYIFIFHNYGIEAGASLFHPHSQIIAIPVIPPDVGRSIKGSKEYYEKHKKCVHCEMIQWEKHNRKRIIFENEDFIAFAPFASKTAFEIRIFPKKHECSFELIMEAERRSLSQVLKIIFAKIYKNLNDPAYNYFIHTAPCEVVPFKFYHWHIEVLPKTSIYGGVELGTGIEISGILPEDAAKILRK